MISKVAATFYFIIALTSYILGTYVQLEYAYAFKLGFDVAFKLGALYLPLIVGVLYVLMILYWQKYYRLNNIKKVIRVYSLGIFLSVFYIAASYPANAPNFSYTKHKVATITGDMQIYFDKCGKYPLIADSLNYFLNEKKDKCHEVQLDSEKKRFILTDYSGKEIEFTSDGETYILRSRYEYLGLEVIGTNNIRVKIQRISN